MGRCFFIDGNSFYCSVEQQEKPILRGRPVIVVPMTTTDYTCAIAASYEAKKLGIRTGTSVRLARGVTPDLAIVEARPDVYLQYHHRLVELLNRHFVSVRVLSIDEMTCCVPQVYSLPDKEQALAQRVKTEICQDLGPYVTCSIGVAANVFLSKVAAERQKPNGLTIWTEWDLPSALFDLRLTDLPGIGSRMRRRLESHGIASVESLWYASPQELRRAWGSVLGERWWHMLRGSQECDYNPPQMAPRKSLGHSHVLPPRWRTLEGCKEILLQLMAKALKRLRAYNMAASAVHVSVQYRKPRSPVSSLWRRRSTKHLHANDDPSWLRVLRPILAALPDLSGSGCLPYWVGIVFTGLLACDDVTLSLFPEDDLAKRSRLAATVDRLNVKHGRQVVDALPLFEQYEVPNRIPFGAPDQRPSEAAE